MQIENNCDGQYGNLVMDVITNGVFKEDRTGTGSFSVFGRTMRFDLTDGKIPLLNSKKVFTKGIIHELVWFLRGDTNVSYLNRHGVTIWDSWATDYGDLGPIYSAMWRRWPSDAIGEFSGKYNVNKPVKRYPDERPVYFFDTMSISDIFSICAKHHVDLNEGALSIPYKISIAGKQAVVVAVFKAQEVLVLQHEDGELVIAPFLRDLVHGLLDSLSEDSKVVIDLSSKASKCRNIGYPRRKFNMLILELWVDILRDIAISDLDDLALCEDWMEFNNFLDDISCVPYYEEWVNSPDKYYLSAEYHNAREYGKNTCMFVPYQNNTNMYVPFRENTSTNGRRVGYIDQIGNLINELKTNPTSRRLVVSAWNPELLPNPNIKPSDNVEQNKQALPPCHTLFQFYTTSISTPERQKIYGKQSTDEEMTAAEVPRYHLSCQLYQRSADIPLGLPFNIAQYSMLVHIISKVCNMVPKEFVWQGGDCHIYKNQVELIAEQIAREPKKDSVAKFVFVEDIKDIDDFSFDSVKIEGYDPHPAIKFPMAAV